MIQKGFVIVDHGLDIMGFFDPSPDDLKRRTTNKEDWSETNMFATMYKALTDNINLLLNGNGEKY